MSLRKYLGVMMAAAGLGLMAVAGFWIHDQRTTMLSEKMNQARNMVEVPYSLLEREHQMEVEGKISRAEAQKRVLDAVRQMRYDGSNYFWINDEHPTMIMHPLKPELEGKDLSTFKDASDKAVFIEFVKAARAPEGGYVYYLWPKPGKDKPVEKLSFVKQFEPWGWVIGTGVYIDDLDAAWRHNALTAGGLALACLILLLAVSIATSSSILRRLRLIVYMIQQLAAKNLSIDNLEITSEDELGNACVALNELKNSLHQVMHAITTTAEQVARASEDLNITSQQITANSEETSAQANVVTGAAIRVNQNLQTVATGAAQTGTSIGEIAKNASEAARIATSAVKAAKTTTLTISKLGESSNEIGQVIKVITSIAEQTNLLALNATIEAARAGEAGKGFAVVASEVKELAKETAKATEDISHKIEAIQSDTKAAVEAIGSISDVINQINEISSTIATSVELQNATTNEMARNATAAAHSSDEITTNIAGVAQAAESTSRGANDTQEAAQQLVETSAELRRLVVQFKIAVDASDKVLEKRDSPHALPKKRMAAHSGS